MEEVEEMKAWMVSAGDSHDLRQVVIGTYRDARGTAAELETQTRLGFEVEGPFDFTIAIKP